jgi:threonine/homoserine efflux transporter RhtA
VALFFLFAAGALAWGAIHVWTGVRLRTLRSSSRLVGLALAVPNLFFLPVGTALAVYTFWVLLSNETRKLFEPAAVSHK